MGRSGARGRSLVTAAALAACLATVGACQALPGVEVERDATLTNASAGPVTVFTASSGGEMAREQTAAPGMSVVISLGSGRCESSWRFQRGDAGPVDLGKVCPGDKVTVTNEGVRHD